MITLIYRDLRTPEQDTPLLDKGGKIKKCTVSSDTFINLWLFKSNRDMFMLEEGKELEDLVDDGLLLADEKTFMENRMREIRLANMSKTQRQMELMKEQMKEELKREEEKKAKRASRRKTTKTED